MNTSNKKFPDKNLHVDNVINDHGLKFIEVRQEPFDVYGLYNYRGETQYKRMPDDIALNVNDGVAHLYLNTSGGRVRFSTNSRHIAIRVKMPKITRFSHMALTGTSGLDLYKDIADGETLGYYKTFVPPYGMTDGYESKMDLGEKKMRHLTINMPSYNDVSELYIGIDEDATIDHGVKYRDLPPIVYYGSSITQGACSSRPGCAYQNIISRRMNVDYINLGFAGNCRAEPIMAEYLATLDMSAFVCDYDHNSNSTEYLAKTHFALYETIRKKHPELPYIMISRPDYRNHADAEARRQVVLKSYGDALTLGDKNVYFIDGKEFFDDEHVDMCMVDACHPTDLGFALMAESIGRALKTILG